MEFGLIVAENGDYSRVDEALVNNQHVRKISPVSK